MKQFSGGQFAAQFSCITVGKKSFFPPSTERKKEKLASRLGDRQRFLLVFFRFPSARYKRFFRATQKPILNNIFGREISPNNAQERKANAARPRLTFFRDCERLEPSSRRTFEEDHG